MAKTGDGVEHNHIVSTKNTCTADLGKLFGEIPYSIAVLLQGWWKSRFSQRFSASFPREVIIPTYDPLVPVIGREDPGNEAAGRPVLFGKSFLSRPICRPLSRPLSRAPSSTGTYRYSIISIRQFTSQCYARTIAKKKFNN